MRVFESRPPILVVDDEPRILESLRDLLEDDFEVLCSNDPRRALDMLHEIHVAVILADQRMPEVTGDHLLARAREVSDATRILITGYTDVSALIRAVNEGQIFTYVPKPWEPTQLKVTVFKAAKHCQEVTQRRLASEELAQQQVALARSEANLRHQSKLLQSILDSMGDGVLVTDENGSMVLLNPAAEQMVGSDARQTPQGKWSETHGIYRPGTGIPYPAAEMPLARAMRGEAVDGVELYVRNRHRPAGMYVSVNARPLREDDGTSKGGVAVVRDITATRQTEDLMRRAKEEAERANRAKSDFLSRMSHELRTPLNSILGFAQLLELGKLGEDDRDNVQHILKGGYHLLDLINEVLDLARIEAGKLTVSTEPVLLSDVVGDAIDIVRPLASQRSVTVDGEAGLCCDRYVQADRQRLKQVLLNLLGNAIKFNREGGSVEVGCVERAPNHLRVEIRDTGHGIAAEDLQKVFTPFERLGADAAGIGGTGLGLALSKRLIEAMGGSVGVESTVDVGSRFSIELLTLQSPEAQLGAGPIDAQGDPASLETSLRGTILYIEDNLSNLRLMERVLARYPAIKLLAAMQGKFGLELAVAHQPDWILLDVHLPDLPGDEVLRRLLAHPKTRHIPVTVVSADATGPQISRLLEVGAREYMTKPLNVKELLTLLEATMHKSARPVG